MKLEEIIERISKLRTRKKYSARELSLMIDKSESYISRLEYRKDFEPSIKVINDIAEACESNLEEFFYYEIDQYRYDHELLQLIKTMPIGKKQALIEFLKK